MCNILDEGTHHSVRTEDEMASVISFTIWIDFYIAVY